MQGQSSDPRYISVEHGLKESILVAFKNCQFRK